MISWNAGKMLVCDAIVADTLAPSYLYKSKKKGGERRDVIIRALTMAHTLVKKLTNLVKISTGEIRSKQYLYTKN